MGAEGGAKTKENHSKSFNAQWQGVAFKEELTPLSHIFSFDPLNNLQGQSYYYSSHFRGQKLQISVCEVSSIAVLNPITHQYCPRAVLVGGRRPSEGVGDGLLNASLEIKE